MRRILQGLLACSEISTRLGSIADDRPLFIRDTTVKYHYLKGNIIGPAYKIPFMGPFLQSVNPKFTEYKAKWDSGELSCVSVFHK